MNVLAKFRMEKIPKPGITLCYSLQQLLSFPSALQTLRMSGARYAVVVIDGYLALGFGHELINVGQFISPRT